MLAARIAQAIRDAVAAQAARRRTIAAAEAVEMALQAAAARRRLGVLLGGEAGAAMVSQTEEAMESLGVRVPERHARRLLPGRW
jgi:eukaryotic-like serine/threonine-protein kinase